MYTTKVKHVAALGRPLFGVIALSQLGVVALTASSDPWQVESVAARAELPEWKVIAATPEGQLTPATSQLDHGAFRTWSVSHGDAGSTRYSSLEQINRRNVHLLQEAWRHQSNDGDADDDGWRGIQCNPIIVDGIMYAPTAGRALVALHADSGAEIWRYQVERPERIGLSDAPARRGLVYWPGDESAGPRVVFGSGEWIYALDPATGNPIADFGEAGRTRIPTKSTPVGVIWGHTYIVPGHYGNLYSYDLRNGKMLWKFNTTPEADEFGADTWVGSERRGANTWGGVALDKPRGIAFLAVGDPHPNFDGTQRIGDNLFSNCLIAVDVRNGERLWHIQNVRHDLWDLDNPAPPNLVTITRGGRRVDAVACVTKTGNTLLIDRVRGEPIFPLELRRAPTSKLPGEITAPYQPAPKRPEPFATVEVTRDNITNISEEARASVAPLFDVATRGWFEPHVPGRPSMFFGVHGGSEWPGGAVDVPTGRLYVAANHIAWTITLFHDDDPPPAKPATSGEMAYQMFCAACHGKGLKGTGMVPALKGLRHRMSDDEVIKLLQTGRNAMPPLPLPTDQLTPLLDFLFARDRPDITEDDAETFPRYATGSLRKVLDAEGYPGTKPPWGTLNCLDLNTGRLLWKVPLGEYEELTERGLPITGTENFGGPTVTAGGLVFCAGTRDEKIRAFDQDTGRELWSAKLPWGGYAPPATYEVDGKQYVVIAASGGGKLGGPTGDAWVAFSLPDSDDISATTSPPQ